MSLKTTKKKIEIYFHSFVSGVAPPLTPHLTLKTWSTPPLMLEFSHTLSPLSFWMNTGVSMFLKLCLIACVWLCLSLWYPVCRLTDLYDLWLLIYCLLIFLPMPGGFQIKSHCKMYPRSADHSDNLPFHNWQLNISVTELKLKLKGLDWIIPWIISTASNFISWVAEGKQHHWGHAVGTDLAPQHLWMAQQQHLPFQVYSPLSLPINGHLIA